MPVYMIRAGANGPVKIGFATDPKRRLTMLQTGHHQRLSIFRLFEGTLTDEAALHDRFAAHRINGRGEWFAFDDAMTGNVGLVEVVETITPKTLDRSNHRAIINELGGPKVVAQALGVQHNVVCHWSVRGIPPIYWSEFIRISHDRIPPLDDQTLRAGRFMKLHQRSVA